MVGILVVTYLVFPETKAYSLEEIAILFNGVEAAPESPYVDELDRKKEPDIIQIEHRE